MRLSALSELNYSEAIELFLTEADVQRARDCLRDEPDWRGLLRVEEIEFSATSTLRQLNNRVFGNPARSSVEPVFGDRSGLSRPAVSLSPSPPVTTALRSMLALRTASFHYRRGIRTLKIALSGRARLYAHVPLVARDGIGLRSLRDAVPEAPEEPSF